jgi:predicted HAD superfamily Cof-like phosphohydrolase
MVKEFHETFGLVVRERPGIPDSQTVQLRVRLIKEELEELQEAFDNHDIVEVADALGDLMYVVLGTAVSCGLPTDQIFDEIHRSNMSKVGGHRDEGGKWIKPPTYSPPYLEPILENADASTTL